MHPYLDQVLQSPSRVLATYGPAGLNVVPVSVVTKDGEALILYDFFMGKTVTNIQGTGDVSLTAWDGLMGIQLKGRATYENAGDFFDASVGIMLERFPERTLRGVVRIIPTAVFSVSAGAEAGKQLV